MKLIIVACLAAVAFAAPQRYGDDESREVVPILRDDRVHPDDGTYSFDVETGDGIYRSESGARLDSAEGAVGQQGQVKFTHPDGESFELTFVANEDGYQPQSDALPVAPAFPHEIPDFVLEQIEKARQEDLNRRDSDETYGN